MCSLGWRTWRGRGSRRSQSSVGVAGDLGGGMSDSIAEHVEMAARQVGVIHEAAEFGPGRPNRGAAPAISSESKLPSRAVQWFATQECSLTRIFSGRVWWPDGFRIGLLDSFSGVGVCGVARSGGSAGFHRPVLGLSARLDGFVTFPPSRLHKQPVQPRK